MEINRDTTKKKEYVGEIRIGIEVKREKRLKGEEEDLVSSIFNL